MPRRVLGKLASGFGGRRVFHLKLNPVRSVPAFRSKGPGDMDMATSRRQQALAERGGCGTECDRIQACATGALEPEAQMVLTDDIRIDQAVARCDQDWFGVAWAEGACTPDVFGKTDGGPPAGNV